MARKTAGKTTGPTSVDAIHHRDKRTNIPTADAQEFVDPADEALPPIHYPREAELSPQLVWRGKEQQNQRDLIVDAPPLYIQEKIAPRVLIENLRRTAERPEDEPELSLFDEFDGLDELSAIEFYQHESNWSNRMILGDSLQAMGSLAEREQLRGKVQMIYIDPPYGIKFNSNWQVKVDKRDVKDGKDTAREAEQIKAFRDTWAGGIGSYLSYLRDRLMVARDLLTDSGSCFIQIGDENVHLVRSLMDEVFGSENFVSQISVNTTTGAGSFAGGTNELPAVIDHIVWYARTSDSLKFRQLFKAKAADGQGGGAYTRIELADGQRRRATPEERLTPPPHSRIFALDNLTSQTTRTGRTTIFPVEIEGHSYIPKVGGWKTNSIGMGKLLNANRLAPSGQTLRYVRYLDDFAAFPVNNSWTDATGGAGADKVYVVQTAAKIVERCMLMCTDPGDLVLDPTCGSGTTAYVAEQCGRRWITMDTSRVALALARQRLMTSKFPYYLLADSAEGRTKEAEVSGQAAALNAPATGDIRHGFVYERVQHITLKSIANNPDIVEGMSREEIDAAIRRHADFEFLYDRPYEDKKRVRVTGPFTFESLSPYRSSSFSTEPAADAPTVSERVATVDPENVDYAQGILDNLARAGIQNGRRNERIEFASLEPHAGEFVQAIGERAGADDSAAPSRIALAIGPQYGTVDARFVKSAVKEALADPDVDLLCVLGFAFDPLVTGVIEEDGITVTASDAGFANVAGERKLGRLSTLMVRMNADLLMGEELAKTSKANLFTVFGEPDIEVRTEADGQLVVDLHGVDVYDPTTGQIRSQETDPVVLWMIDTDYDGESFFVRHCYFTGGNDPYKRLRAALKADVDEDAWESLYRTTSRPFPRPEPGRIAVKVINDYGDEVMKVIDLDTMEEES